MFEVKEDFAKGVVARLIVSCSGYILCLLMNYTTPLSLHLRFLKHSQQSTHELPILNTPKSHGSAIKKLVDSRLLQPALFTAASIHRIRHFFFKFTVLRAWPMKDSDVN